MQIQGIQGFENLTRNIKQQNGQNDFAANFKDMFMDALYSTSELEQNQEKLRVDFVNGNLENLHDLSLATQKTDIAIQTVVEVRNKIIDAYKEIMRMQI